MEWKNNGKNIYTPVIY